jgi:hypothetical protein
MNETITYAHGPRIVTGPRCTVCPLPGVFNLGGQMYCGKDAKPLFERTDLW